MDTSVIGNTWSDVVQCSLCYETYNDSSKLPKALPCLHTFCLECMQRYHESQMDSNLACPMCKKPFSVPEGRITNLPNNFHIVHVQDNLRHERTTQPKKESAGNNDEVILSVRDLAIQTRSPRLTSIEDQQAAYNSIISANDQNTSSIQQPQSNQSDHEPTGYYCPRYNAASTIAQFVILFLTISYSITCICISVIYKDDCPASPEIPVIIIAQGVFGLVFCMFFIYICYKTKCKRSFSSVQLHLNMYYVLKYALPTAVVLIYVPIIANTVYVYIIKGSVSSDPDDPNFCDPTVYNVTYWFDTVFHIVLCLIVYNLASYKCFKWFLDTGLDVSCKTKIIWGLVSPLCNVMLPIIIIGGLNIGLCPKHPTMPIIALVLGSLEQLVITVLVIALLTHGKTSQWKKSIGAYACLCTSLVLLVCMVGFTVEHGAQCWTSTECGGVLYLIKVACAVYVFGWIFSVVSIFSGGMLVFSIYWRCM